MANIYECTMTKTITVNIKADSIEEAQFWLQTHGFDDIEMETTLYDVDFSEGVNGEVFGEKYAIDISTKDEE